jgi:hypothetical protein
MSTRCQVEFIYKWKDENGKTRSEKRTIYRHSDGYPGSMVPDLLTFIRWNQGRMDDVEYTAANWVFWNKRRDEDCFLNDKRRKKFEERTHNIRWDDPIVAGDTNHLLKIGIGVDQNNQYHGDIEYLYKVIVQNVQTGGHYNTTRILVESYAVDRGDWTTPVTSKSFKKIGGIYYHDPMSEDEINAAGKKIRDLNDKMKGRE